MYGDFISVTATQWAFRNSKSKGVARNVLLAICAGCNTDFFSWPSIDTLMEFANCTRVTVMKSLEELLSIGEIEYEPGGGAGKTNKYYLTAFANSINGAEKQYTTVHSKHETVYPGELEEVEEVKAIIREEEIPPLAFPKPQKRIKTRTSFRRQESRVRQIDADPRPPWLIDKDNREAKAKSESDEAVEKMKWFLSLDKKKASK